MTRSTDLLIVGTGIAGLTSALAAADVGLRVVLCGEARTGSASRAAAGMLAPSLDGMPDAVQQQAFAARDFYPEFLSALRERSGIDVPLNRRGILEVAHSDEERVTLLSRAPSWAERLDREDLARAEPLLAAHAGALFHRHDGAVDNVILLDALDVAVARTRAVARLDVTVAAFDVRSGRPRATIAGGEVLEAESIVIASGAWANGLQGLPHPVAVRPLCGQLMRLDSTAVSHVVYAGGGYLVPRGTSLLIGATTEETGFESSTTAEGLAALRSIATRAIPALGGAAVIDHWAGLRPVTPDALPILGADPQFPALLYACGFSRNGILLAPWAAKQMVSLFLGKEAAPELAPFHVSRFPTSRVTP
ncbi:MAG: FAD-dependent oxidoreductase [Gemmatimonadota bacterium]